MAKEISGIAQCITGYNINFDGFYFPRGRHLRGAFGAICALEELPIISEFFDLKNDSLIFRDMFPVCDSCKNIIYPNKNDKIVCKRCKTINDKFSVKNISLPKYSLKQVIEGGKYRFSIIVKDESFLNKVLYVIEYMVRNNFSIGRMITSGWGRFRLLEYNVNDKKPEYLSKAILISEAIVDKGGDVDINIGNFVNKTNTFEFIKLKGLSRYREVSNVDGFYYGNYGTFGFGEFLSPSVFGI